MKVRLTDGNVVHTKTHVEENGSVAEEWICPICGEACWVYVDEWHVQNCHTEDFWCEHMDSFEED